MQTNKKNYLSAVTLIKEFGICPSCYTKGELSKSGSNTYHCSCCHCISVLEKDKAIIRWYAIRCGIRVLRSQEISASAPRWKVMLEEVARIKGKRFKQFRG